MDALTSGKITSDYIGRTVYLSNSVITCQEWVIADVNRSGTGTVDLFSKTTLTNDNIHYSTSTNNYGYYINTYNNSNLDKYLSNDVYNGFAKEIKNALSCMNEVGKYIVAPSICELGADYKNDGTTVEDHLSHYGYIYPIFSPACRPNDKARIKKPNGNGANYWTRSPYELNHTSGYGGTQVFMFYNGGSADFASSGGWGVVVARIRFAKK